jgi:hypothetical protein
MSLHSKKSSFYKRLFAVTSLVVFAFIFALSAKAQATSTSSVKNDFVLEPGKVEIFVNPGDSVTKSITVTNRAASTVSFKVEVEDFIGSDQSDKPVVLLGNEKSPYSFRDNIIPQVTNFSLGSSESISIPIKINVPKDAQPGGFYTSILVSNEPTVSSTTQSSDVQGSTKIISRVGTLFFIRVNGVAKESGSLQDLRVVSPTSDSPDTYKFDILFKNDGNVHLVPFGYVTVSNLFGRSMIKIPVDAYFALPHSIRYRQVEWNAPFLFGRYQATVELNRGYGSNLIDTKTIAFWVIPWKVTVIVLVVLLVLFLALFTFFRKFKFVAKQ